jgi:hypothetical protein
MEKTTPIVMINLGNVILLGNISLQCLEHRAKRGGKNDVECHFPSRFSNYFRIPLCGGLKFGEQVGWALFSSFGLWARWMAFGPFFSCLVYRGSPVLLGFGPLVDHWGVGFGPWWTEKIGLYKTSRTRYNAFPLRECVKARIFQRRKLL